MQGIFCSDARLQDFMSKSGAKIALSIWHDVEKALEFDDWMQEATIETAKALAIYDREPRTIAAETFVYQYVSRRVVALRRQKNRRKSVRMVPMEKVIRKMRNVGSTESIECAEHTMELEEQRKIVARAIRSELTYEERQVLRLVVTSDELPQIATILGCSKDDIDRTYRVAIAKLQSAICKG